MDVMIMGRKIGTCDEAVGLDLDANQMQMQFHNFNPSVPEFNHLSAAEYFTVDFLSGKFAVYDDQGEVATQGKVFTDANL